MVTRAPEDLSGVSKAAILLLQLGQEQGSKVLNQLQEAEMEEVVAEIARLKTVDGDVADNVVHEFFEMAVARKYVTHGGIGYARDLLEDSLGSERAREILGRLEAAISEMPFQFLRRTDARQLLSFLQDEHPQTIALVLAHLSVEQAPLILGNLPAELQADVAHRIAVMDRTSPEIVRKVEQVLQRRMSSILQPTDLSTVGGLEPLIEIINHSDRVTEKMILDGLEGRSPELAEQIRAHMFMFEDIVGLEDKSIQAILRDVDNADLATALKGVRDEVRDKVLGNLSERAAENLVEEMDYMGAVRVSVVEEAQAKVVRVIRRLEESGEIVITRGGEDEFVS